jgi:pimeloyl-ACP methyl ester carboxylesterase
VPAPIAVHELSGRPGLPPLLISHATGFCGHAYAPVAGALRDRFHCYAVDHRGHGATPPPADWGPGVGVDWRRFGDDTLEVARRLAPSGGLVGFGHSMGAATLLMAARRDPGRFEQLVLFEPIAYPPTDSTTDIEGVPLVVGARRRRRTFASFDEAFENFHSKPPMSRMTVESLRGYVAHGLRPSPAGGVELCCPPEFEAATFIASRDNGVWDLLPEVEVPVLVLSGVVEENEPSAISGAVAERLPNGRSHVFPEQDHLGPFSHPEQVADAISTSV